MNVGVIGSGSIGPDLAYGFLSAIAKTGGTVYLQGPEGNAFAVRVLASTGRVRVLTFDVALGSWVER